MVFGFRALLGSVLLISSCYAGSHTVPGPNGIPVRMVAIPEVEAARASPRDICVGVTVERFSAAGIKQPTANASEMDIYARHAAMSAHAQLEKRACDPTGSEQECRRPPLFPMPACFWCPKSAVLNELSVCSSGSLYNRRVQKAHTCQPGYKSAEYVRLLQPIGHRRRVRNLSRLATQLACRYGKYSIWHLWPNRKNEANNSRLLNFHGIFDSTNRLYSISQMGVIPETSPPKDYFRVYFENMSEAMAQMGTGQIYMITQTPQNLAQYGVPPLAPNIWSGKELPALRNHLQELESTLIVIDATQYDPNVGNVVAYRVDWRTLNTQPGQINPFRRDVEYEPVLEPYNMTEEVGPWTQKRADLCGDSGIDDQPAGMD